MALTATRRTVLTGGMMLLTGRALAQQATTLTFYSVDFEPEAATLAFVVPYRTGGRYQIERIIGFDMLEAALGEKRAAGGEVALLKGVQSGEFALVAASHAITDYVPEANVFLLPFIFHEPLIPLTQARPWVVVGRVETGGGDGGTAGLVAGVRGAIPR